MYAILIACTTHPNMIQFVPNPFHRIIFKSGLCLLVFSPCSWGVVARIHWSSFSQHRVILVKSFFMHLYLFGAASRRRLHSSSFLYSTLHIPGSRLFLYLVHDCLRLQILLRLMLVLWGGLGEYIEEDRGWESSPSNPVCAHQQLKKPHATGSKPPFCFRMVAFKA